MHSSSSKRDTGSKVTVTSPACSKWYGQQMSMSLDTTAGSRDYCLLDIATCCFFFFSLSPCCLIVCHQLSIYVTDLCFMVGAWVGRIATSPVGYMSVWLYRFFFTEA